MPPQTQNRKDLLQAYRLMTQRTALALLAGEPDSPNQPLRRRNTATVSGILAGVIACAVFGVMGLLSPGPVNGLTKAGTLTVDKDTATAYVPCNSGELCPTLNYASALLALDSTSPNRVNVNQASLAKYRIGPTIGIAGLPQDLPIGSNLVKGPWSVCIDNGVSTLVGGAKVGGSPLTSADAELVQSQGQDFVLWKGTRMPIAGQVLTALFPNATVPSVTPAWINQLAEGPAFQAPAIQGSGTTVQGPTGPAKVGQVYFASTASGTQDYVLEEGGKLDTVSALQATLLEEQPGGANQQQPIPASTATADLQGSLPSGGLPSTLPKTPVVSSPSCITYGAGLSRTITTGDSIPANATPTGNSSPMSVNQVWLPEGSGALIGVTADTNKPTPPVRQWYLLDGATRYGLAGSGVASVLGYDLAKEQTVLPAQLVNVLPEGKALDPSAAQQPS